jgi:hypothetical protein
MPSPYFIVAIQFSMGLLIYGLIARCYVLPWLAKQDFYAALAPILLLQGFRFIGLSLLAPEQVGAGQDTEALKAIAYGDLAAAVTGVIAAIAAFQRSSLTVPLAWLATVVGLADLALVGITTTSVATFDYGVGFIWATLGLFAPVILLAHLYVIRTLLQNRGTDRATVAKPA